MNHRDSRENYRSGVTSSRKRDRSNSRSNSPVSKRHSKRDNRERDRSRSRSRERSNRDKKVDKQDKRDRRRSRSRSKSINRDKEKEKPVKLSDETKSKSIKSTNINVEVDPKVQEQLQLEEEIRKRKERVKAWQEAKSKALGIDVENSNETINPTNSDTSANNIDEGTDNRSEEINVGEIQSSMNSVDDETTTVSVKKWSLEDDDEEDQENDNTLSNTSAESTSNAIDDSDLLLLPTQVLQSNVNTESVECGEEHSGDTIRRRPKLKFSTSVSTSHSSTDHESNDSSILLEKVNNNQTPEKVEKWTSLKQSSIAPKNSPFLQVKSAVYDENSNVSNKIASIVSVGEEMKSKVVQEDEADPLDAFMSSLYNTGEVESQKELKALTNRSTTAANVVSLSQLSKSFNLAPTGTATKASNGVDSSYQSEDEDEYSFYTGTGKLNPFGSNFITLDDIISGKLPPATNSAIGNVRAIPSWESDRGGNSPFLDTDKDKDLVETAIDIDKNIDAEIPATNDSISTEVPVSAAESKLLEETEEERELREEKEHMEFMEAFRQARQKEDSEIADQKKMNDIIGKEDKDDDEKVKKPKDSLGVIFANDGDILDEDSILKSQKKSSLELLEEVKQKQRELRLVDHSIINYIKFRKNIYVVPRALAKLSEEELKAKRDDLAIVVRGKACPAPVDTWEQCGLSDRLLELLEIHKLETPFAIQRQAIPAIMCGRDIIGVAKTGSGKTLAFLLPMIRHIQDQPPLKDNEGGPIGLIMAPARELALQIRNEAKKFVKLLNMRVACVYGGAGVADQIAELRRGAEIVVCTPGRMIELLGMQAGRMLSMKRVTMVVLDEADRMFDMGFEPQIKTILQSIRPDRQTVLFSATFPKQIEKVAKSILSFPLEIIIGERSMVNKDITQIMEIHEDEDKFLRLLQLLGIWYEQGSILVFVDKQDKCDSLYSDLLKSGYPCVSLHGGKDQVDRDFTIHQFKQGIFKVMIATSVAGRGLDVPDIVCVINYNCPNHLEDYVHRVGRTGRAGRKGTAYTFISSGEEQYSPILIKALQRAHLAVPLELQDLFNRFKDKVDKGLAQYSSSGFIGKGFKFDGSELNEQQKLASLQRRQYEAELGLGADEEVADEEDDEALPSDSAVTGTNVQTAMQTAVALTSVNVNMTPLERAKALAAGINVSGLPSGTGTLTAGKSAATPLIVDSRVALAKAQMLARQLGSTMPNGAVAAAVAAASGQAGSGFNPLASIFFQEEMDINDYPVNARRRLNLKKTIDDIHERTGVRISCRGTFVPPDKKPTPGERRLYLMFEGESEISIKQARLEVQQILDEEVLRIGSGSMLGAVGRYSVL